MTKAEKIVWVILSALLAMATLFGAGVALVTNETFFCLGGWCIAGCVSMLYMVRLSSKEK